MQPGAHPAGDRRIPGAHRLAAAAERDDVPVAGRRRRRVLRELGAHPAQRARTRHAGFARQRAPACRSTALPHHSSIASCSAGSAADAVEAALEDLGGRAKVVFEKQRLAERQQELEPIARRSRPAARTVPSASRAALRSDGVGTFAIALEVRAGQHDGRRVGRVRRAARGGRRLDRLVELPLVVERARPRQIGSRGLCAAAGSTTQARQHQRRKPCEPTSADRSTRYNGIPDA